MLELVNLLGLIAEERDARERVEGLVKRLNNEINLISRMADVNPENGKKVIAVSQSMREACVRAVKILDEVIPVMQSLEQKMKNY